VGRVAKAALARKGPALHASATVRGPCRLGRYGVERIFTLGAKTGLTKPSRWNPPVHWAGQPADHAAWKAEAALYRTTGIAGPGKMRAPKVAAFATMPLRATGPSITHIGDLSGRRGGKPYLTRLTHSISRVGPGLRRLTGFGSRAYGHTDSTLSDLISIRLREVSSGKDEVNRRPLGTLAKEVLTKRNRRSSRPRPCMSAYEAACRYDLDRGLQETRRKRRSKRPRSKRFLHRRAVRSIPPRVEVAHCPRLKPSGFAGFFARPFDFQPLGRKTKKGAQSPVAVDALCHHSLETAPDAPLVAKHRDRRASTAPRLEARFKRRCGLIVCLRSKPLAGLGFCSKLAKDKRAWASAARAPAARLRAFLARGKARNPSPPICRYPPPTR